MQSRSQRRGATSPRLDGTAFGIDIEAAFSIPELPVGRTPSSNPRSILEPASTEELRRAWPFRDAERLLERTLPDGRPMMVVEHHEDVGFHVWTPRHGRHLVSPDGAHVWCALPRIAAWRWERLLFAQVLPLTAALRGRALFHASGVALEGAAIAFVGFSGAGKSSIAAHLVARGASLVTDDVLALERAGEEMIAHPGTGLAGIDTRELATMSADGRARLGTKIGMADKAYLAVPVVERPLPLRALYFIAIVEGDSIAIRTNSSTASQLLGSGFIAYLPVHRHLIEHLEVCARIAATVPTFEVAAPAPARAVDVAHAVEAHAQALLG